MVFWCQGVCICVYFCVRGGYVSFVNIDIEEGAKGGWRSDPQSACVGGTDCHF